METELRQVTIEEYWPLIVRNTEEFGQIAVAENPEFNKLASCIYQVLQETFVRDATEYGVGRWENILKISPESGDTLEDRKARILTYLNVKLPYTVRVLRQMLVGLLGEENFTLTFDNDTATLTVAVSLDTTDAQIADVKTLLDRVLPRNLVTEMEWADGFPVSYTRLDYLEGQGAQYIQTNYVPNNETGLYAEWCFTNSSNSVPMGIKEVEGKAIQITRFGIVGSTGFAWGNWFAPYYWYPNTFERMYSTLNWLNDRKANVNIPNVKAYTETFTRVAPPDGILPFTPVEKLFIFTTGHKERKLKGQIYVAKISQGNKVVSDFVPALDETGTPCMFDLVSKQPFYNSGTGDFLYPGAEQAVQTLDLDLDAKSYAKLTPYGIRRLYHVPKGCNMTKDEYAAANGFKELVEPPMPLEGYWTPEWRETETQLICDWVETEPPTEVTENE